jgi:TolB-like protein/tetratricopeptide (TPR) repeat protein
VPAEVERIVGKALAKKPEERYQHVDDMLVDLRALERSAAGRARRDDPRRPVSTVAWLGIVAALLLLALSVYWLVAPRARPGIDSVAVLPFVNTGGDAAMEFLSDGISESITGRLVQLQGLQVRPFSAMLPFKGTRPDPTEVARRLKVGAVLAGRLAQSGDVLMISVELIDAGRNIQLWSDQFRLSPAEVFAAQERIALEVAGKLQPRLASKASLPGQHIPNAEAHQEYLKGRFFWNKRTGEGTRKAIAHFEKAIEKDPKYVHSWAGLAQSYVLLTYVSATSPHESYPKARSAAEKTLELDPNNADAHVTLGLLKRDYEWDWAGAEQSFRRALELGPNIPTVHHWYAETLYLFGRFPEALGEMKRAQELDPTSLIIAKQVGDVYLFWRRYDDAISEYEKTLKMDSGFVWARLALATAYLSKGQIDKGLAEARRTFELEPDRPRAIAVLANALALSGNHAKAHGLLRQMLDRRRKSFFPPLWIANVYLALGDKDNSVAWLREAMKDPEIGLLHLKVSANWDPLRGDRRFQELLRRMNFPP